MALQSKLIDKIVVSTDNKKIAGIVKRKGLEVPFLRPKGISHDYSEAIDVVKHTLRFLSSKQSYTPEIIVLLQPTSPIREAGLIDKSVRMLKTPKASSVVAVSEVKKHPFISFLYNKRYLKPFKRDFHRYSTRQLRIPLYAPTGSVYTFWYETLEKYDSIYGPRIKPLIIQNDEFTVDIDSLFDLFISEMTILYWKKFRQRFLS